MRPVHEYADVFPAMSADEFAALQASISERGLLEPIWMYEGKILDGRHRARACAAAGREPLYREYKGADPLGFALALNLKRRHLTTEQRAMLGVAVKAMEAEAAAERMKAGTNPPADLPEGTGDARDIAGARVGVSGKLVDQAEKIANEAPDVAERMRAGGYGSVAAAARVADLPECERERIHKAIDEGAELGDVLPASEKKTKSRKALTSSDSNDWYTGEDLIALAREFLGEIDLDPASSVEANTVVGARKIYTINDDGLAQDWHGRVWNNPPNGIDADDRSSMQGKFAAKAIGELEAGRAWGLFNVNAAVGAVWFRPLWAYPICFLYGRPAYWRPGGAVGDQPTHFRVVVCIANEERWDDFRRVFNDAGHVVMPKTPCLGCEMACDCERWGSTALAYAGGLKPGEAN